jgi:hypothetical protein
MEKNRKEYNELTTILKTDNKRMVTSWLAFSHIDFIEGRKAIVELDSGKECEILWKKNSEGAKRYALFFKYGYYQWNERWNRHDFIFINNNEPLKITVGVN